MTENKALQEYKVIADYPGSPYKIGDLVEFSTVGTSFHCTTTKEYDSFREDIVEVENYISIGKLNDWPHLFQKVSTQEENKSLPIDIELEKLNEKYPFKNWEYNSRITESWRNAGWEIQNVWELYNKEKISSSRARELTRYIIDSYAEQYRNPTNDNNCNLLEHGLSGNYKGIKIYYCIKCKKVWSYK